MFEFLFFLAISYGLQILLTKPPESPKAATLDDFQLPTVELGREIPYLFGTDDITGPNVTWDGDLRVIPIKGKHREYGLFGPKPTIGYRYYLGVQMVLCHGPADALYEIRSATSSRGQGKNTGGSLTDRASRTSSAATRRRRHRPGRSTSRWAAPTSCRTPISSRSSATRSPPSAASTTLVLNQVELGTSPYISPWALSGEADLQAHRRRRRNGIDEKAEIGAPASRIVAVESHPASTTGRPDADGVRRRHRPSSSFDERPHRPSCPGKTLTAWTSTALPQRRQGRP